MTRDNRNGWQFLALAVRKVGLSLMFAYLLIGCATICNRHTNATFSLNSSIPQTQVAIWKDAKLIKSVQTPASVVLDSSDGFFCRARYRFEFSKDGYLTTTESRSASFSAWYLGNIIFGGLIGILIVDPLSGAMYSIDDETIDVNLVPKDGLLSMVTEGVQDNLESEYQLVAFNYDEKTRKGSIELKVNGNAFAAARAWARAYIASVAKDKNVAINTDLKTNNGRFTLGQETVSNGNLMKIEFETLD